MTTLIINNWKIDKTHFSDLKELFDYAIDNQMIWEIWSIDKKNITPKTNNLYNDSFDESDLINI